MKIDIIRIGNSRGIRLPKAVIDQCQFTEQVELEVRRGEVVLRAATRKSRDGWEEAFQTARAEAFNGDEAAEFEAMKNAFDDAEWTWDEGKRGEGKAAATRKAARKRT